MRTPRPMMHRWSPKARCAWLVVGLVPFLASLPDVKTMKEAGLPDVQLETWNGLVAPAGRPCADHQAAQ